MRGKLFLHEAIAVVLITAMDRTATTEDIALKISERGLYERRGKKPLPAFQIRQRAKLGRGHYHNLFEWIEPNKT